MAKIRLFELAKELDIDSKEIIDFLGGELKSQSGLDDAQVESVRKKFTKKPQPKEARAERPAKAPDGAVKKAAPADKTGEPKKKKPILVFRPENSSMSGAWNKDGRGQAGGQGQKKKNPAQNQGERRNPRPQGQRPQEGQPNERRVIRANVPTTAETYREFAKEEERPVRKPAPEASAVQEVKQEAAAEAVVNETAAVNETAEVKEVRAEAPAKETVVNENVKEDVKAEAAETVKETAEAAETQAPETPLRPVRKNVFREMEEKKREQELRRQQEAAAQAAREEKNPRKKDDKNRNAGAKDGRQSTGANRPLRDGQNRGQRQNAQNQGDRRNPNREGSQSGQQKSGRPNFHFSENNNRTGRPQQGQQNTSGGLKQGGSFQRGRSQGSQASAQPAFSQKSDVRGKKENKSDKDRRNNNDRTGKNQENFRNLSRKNETHKKPEVQKVEEQIKMIVLPDVITLKDLSDKMKMKPSDLIKKLFLKGKMLTPNSELSYEEAEEIALEYEILCEKEEQVDVIEELLKEEEEDEKLMVKRPPVVCVMGHVDHGKTSLLDAIRETNVTAREAGGITQHIGAYMIEHNGEKITFLDTPGHEAFTAMRMRGAQATDIAILVIAADDGVMPQTVEAINHAKAAGVDVIVAVNKIDKPDANVDRVKQELTEYGLIAEDWGGDTVFCPVSAKTGEGIENLLEMILLVTEVKELKANPNRTMRGIVIEAKLDKGRGPVAKKKKKKGTLKVGDFVSAGSTYGRVRAMLDADGNNLKSALPSTPVEILGLNGVPNAGEICIGHKNEKDARSFAETFVAEEKKQKLNETKQRLTMDSLFEQIQAGEIKELPIIVKADVQGSVEAVRNSLEKLSNEEVAVKVIHSGVGAINESDVTLASASNALIIGFNVRPDAQAKSLSESEEVDIKLYRVIYQAIEDVERALKGMKAPVYEEKILGHAEIRQTFKASGVGMIAGCYVTDGIVERNCQVRIKRDKDQIYEGPLVSLKRFKDDVREAREGYECGMVFEKFNDLQEGDQIEAYKMVEVEQK